MLGSQAGQTPRRLRQAVARELLVTADAVWRWIAHGGPQPAPRRTRDTALTRGMLMAVPQRKRYGGARRLWSS